MADGKERLNVIIEEKNGMVTVLGMHQHRMMVSLPQIGEFLTIQIHEGKEYKLKVKKIDHYWYGDDESGGNILVATINIYCERV